jgi:D-aspartate ligase
MDLDYRLDSRDGRYHLLDFNPRIGAQFRLFKDTAGIDVVRALYLDLTGQPVRVGPQIEGRTFVAEIQDVLASLAYWRSGTLVIGDWWRSLRRIDEAAWYAADDPLPFLLMCLHMPLRAVSRALRSDRRSLTSAGQRRVTLNQQEPCQNAPLPMPPVRSSFISREL